MFIGSREPIFAIVGSARKIRAWSPKEIKKISDSQFKISIVSMKK